MILLTLLELLSTHSLLLLEERFREPARVVRMIVGLEVPETWRRPGPSLIFGYWASVSSPGRVMSTGVVDMFSVWYAELVIEDQLLRPESS